MSHKITRRQAIFSLAALSAGAMLKPTSIFASPVKDKVRFVVIGDWGTGDSEESGIAAQMVSAYQHIPYDFVIAAGDNIYPNGSPRHFRKNFEQPFSRLLDEKLKFYAVLGNHDVEQGRHEQCDYPLFNMSGQCYYTLKQGDGLVEFFMLDSTDFTGTQATWLENALQSSKAKWKIAVFHHPIYSSGKSHGSSKGLRKILEPMFTRHGVQAAFSGHDHIYERTKVQQGIQYFVTGAGGKTRRGDVDLHSDFRAVSFDEDNHFMLIDIDDKGMEFQAISETGQVVDRGIIKQG